MLILALVLGCWLEFYTFIHMLELNVMSNAEREREREREREQKLMSNELNNGITNLITVF